jgi:hypothetical protein
VYGAKIDEACDATPRSVIFADGRKVHDALNKAVTPVNAAER